MFISFHAAIPIFSHRTRPPALGKLVEREIIEYKYSNIYYLYSNILTFPCSIYIPLPPSLRACSLPLSPNRLHPFPHCLNYPHLQASWQFFLLLIYFIAISPSNHVCVFVNDPFRCLASTFFPQYLMDFSCKPSCGSNSLPAGRPCLHYYLRHGSQDFPPHGLPIHSLSPVLLSALDGPVSKLSQKRCFLVLSASKNQYFGNWRVFWREVPAIYVFLVHTSLPICTGLASV